jgi:hypothetical protein
MRRLGLFALIFIVLAGLYWLLEGQGNRSPKTVHLLTSFKPAQVERINITSPGTGAIVLQRTDKAWQVSIGQAASYAANSSAVENLLESLAMLKADSLVSRNAERHALYEVSKETGLRVEALDRDKRALAALLIGKSGPNIISTYVRNDDSDQVYLVDGILQNAAAKSLNEWRDKTIFSFKPEQVTAYTVIGTSSLALNKTNGKWLIGTEHEPANTAAVEQAVRALTTLSAADFAEGPLETFGLAAPEQTVTAALADGTRLTLLLGKGMNAFQQYAKKADDGTIFIVEKHILGMLCPTMEELTAPETKEAKEEIPAESPPVE